MEFSEILNKSNVHDDWKSKDPITRVNDNENFANWHAKTVDKNYDDFRNKLSTRINNLK